MKNEEEKNILVPCGFLNYNIIFDAQVPPQGFQTIPPVIRNSQVWQRLDGDMNKLDSIAFQPIHVSLITHLQ